MATFPTTHSPSPIPIPIPLPSTLNNKPQVAQLSCPTRFASGWCLSKLHIISRLTKRWVILRNCMLEVFDHQPPQAALVSRNSPVAPVLSVCICGAALSTSSGRREVIIKAEGQRILLQWDTDKQFRSCIAAFNYANRDVHQFYKLVDNRQLGRARASKVVFAFDVSAGTHSAMKILSKKAARPSERVFAEREVSIRCSVQHPALVQTLDIFESPDNLYLVTEFMSGGPLQKRLINRAAPLPEGDARIIMARTFCALRHLHGRGIVHRNVKPENIMLDNVDDGKWASTAKLSNLSLACRLGDSDAALAVVGTPDFLAPEASSMVTSGDGTRSVRFGTEVDMWAAGVMLYNILSLTLPFDAESPSEVLKKVRQGTFDFTPHAFARTSHEARSFIRALLNPSRRKRLTAAAALQHPWFTGGIPLEPTAAPRPISRKSARAAAAAGLPSARDLPASIPLVGLNPARKFAIEKFRAAIAAVRILNRWKWAVRVPYDPPAVVTPEPSPMQNNNTLNNYNFVSRNYSSNTPAASSKGSVSSKGSIASNPSFVSAVGTLDISPTATSRRPRVTGSPPVNSPRISNSSTVRTRSSASDEQLALKLSVPPSPKRNYSGRGLQAFARASSYRMEDRNGNGNGNEIPFRSNANDPTGVLHSSNSFRVMEERRRMVASVSSPNMMGIRVLQSPSPPPPGHRSAHSSRDTGTLERQWSLRDNSSPASSTWGS